MCTLTASEAIQNGLHFASVSLDFVYSVSEAASAHGKAKTNPEKMKVEI